MGGSSSLDFKEEKGYIFFKDTKGDRQEENIDVCKNWCAWMVKQEANVSGACILSVEGGSPNEQLLSAYKVFCYLVLSMFLCQTLAFEIVHYIIKSHRDTREMTISKAMWCITCTSRTVSQRPEGFACNQLGNSVVGLCLTHSAPHFCVLIPIGELAGLGMEGEERVTGLKDMVSISLECIRSPDTDRAA